MAVEVALEPDHLMPDLGLVLEEALDLAPDPEDEVPGADPVRAASALPLNSAITAMHEGERP